MGSYCYKYTRDLIPPYITEAIENYEGGCDYDGDMWIAASNYISELESELVNQYSKTNTIDNKNLLLWLKSRKETSYVNKAPLT